MITVGLSIGLLLLFQEVESHESKSPDSSYLLQFKHKAACLAIKVLSYSQNIYI